MYTWDDIIDLELLWKKAFDGDDMPRGFGVGPEQVPIL